MLFTISLIWRIVDSDPRGEFRKGGYFEMQWNKNGDAYNDIKTKLEQYIIVKIIVTVKGNDYA